LNQARCHCDREWSHHSITLIQLLKKTENTLANFASDGGAVPTSVRRVTCRSGVRDLIVCARVQVYEYEGMDYRDLQAKATLDNWIEPPKRERKLGGYNESAYYRDALRVGPVKAKSKVCSDTM
jgi:hypothetical protein